MLARRAVQAACKDRNAAGHNLVDQINDLATQGIISGHVLALAHSARWIGNDGAHPGEEAVTEEDAREAVNVMRLLLSLYETEYLLEQRHRLRGQT